MNLLSNNIRAADFKNTKIKIKTLAPNLYASFLKEQVVLMEKIA